MTELPLTMSTEPTCSRCLSLEEEIAGLRNTVELQRAEYARYHALLVERVNNAEVHAQDVAATATGALAQAITLIARASEEMQEILWPAPGERQP